MSLSKGLGPLGADPDYVTLHGRPESIDDPGTGNWQGPYSNDADYLYQYTGGNRSGWKSSLGAALPEQGKAAAAMQYWPDPRDALKSMDPNESIRTRLEEPPPGWQEGGMPRVFGAARYALNRPGNINSGVTDILDQGAVGPMGVAEPADYGDFGLTGEAARRAVALGPKYEPIFWKFPGARASGEPLYYIEGPQGCAGMIDRYLGQPARIPVVMGPIRGYPTLELRGVPRIMPTVRDGEVKDTQTYPVNGYWGEGGVHKKEHKDFLGWNVYPDPGASHGVFPSPPDAAHESSRLKFQPGFFALGFGQKAGIAASYEGAQDVTLGGPNATPLGHWHGMKRMGGGCPMM